MLIELSNISKTYNRNQNHQCKALSNINLTIETGELVSIVGKSGSGKTTLLNIIGFLDSYDHGEYLFSGEVIKDKNDRQLSYMRNQKVGFVLQDFALMGNMSVYDNIAIPMYLQGKRSSTIRETVEAVAKAVDLHENLKKKAKYLSGGQKQRVAIARALSNNPKLILADEPTGSLDTKTASDIINVLKRANEFGTTVIIVTHDIDIAKSCNRIICLEDGKILPVMM